MQPTQWLNLTPGPQVRIIKGNSVKHDSVFARGGFIQRAQKQQLKTRQGKKGNLYYNKVNVPIQSIGILSINETIYQTLMYFL